MGLLDFPSNPLSQSVDGDGFDANNFEDGFVIEEQDTKDPALKISLRGNQMPKIPFKWGGEQHIVKEYYAGSTEPVVHVMGAREPDLKISGRLHAKKLTHTPPNAKLPYDVTTLLDSVRLRGNLLQLTLGEWKRYGYLTSCEFDMKKLSDVEYNLTFQIVGFDKPRKIPLLGAEKSFPLTINRLLAAALAKGIADYSSVPKNCPQSIAGLLNSLINTVATPIAALNGFVDGIVTTAEDITASLSRAEGLVKNCQAALNQYQRRLGGISYSLSFNLIPVPDRFSTYSFIQGAMSTGSDFRNLLAQMQNAFAGLSKTVPRARRLVRNGDTLQRIAVEYFNDANQWNRIYDHNKLTTSVLNVGTVLEIPSL